MSLTGPVRESLWQRFPKLRDALLCLSSSNFCFLRVWEELLGYRRSDEFLMKEVPSRADYLAAVTSVILLAAVLFVAVLLCKKYLSLSAYFRVRFASYALVMIPLNSLRGTLAGVYTYLREPLLALVGKRPALLAVGLVALILIWCAWKVHRRLSRAVVFIQVMLLPFCGLTFGQALWRAARYSGQPFGNYPLAPRLADARTAPRVVWIMFDEWDYRLTFVDRPADLAMPAVDRLQSESLHAENAHAPTMETSTSLPSLLTGRRLRFVGSGRSTFSAEETIDLSRNPWNRTTTVFNVARQAGYNTALIGWFFPYCRMLNDSLTDCAWWPMPNQANSTGNTFPQKVVGQTASLVESIALSPFGQSASWRYKVTIVKEFLDRADAALSDPALGLVFLHVPVPHTPHPYNRLTGRFDLKNSPVRGYTDSLALTDRMVAEWRELLERNGTWQKTAFVISADHPFRESRKFDGRFDARVPFLLKLPGQTTAARYDAPFNTIVSANLLLSIMSGKVSTVPQAIAWLDRHHQDLDAPVGSGH